MRKINCIIFTCMVFFIHSWGQNVQYKYNLISEGKEYNSYLKKYIKTAEVNYTDVERLKGPLRALASYYSCIAGSHCFRDSVNNEICDLTTALGLGVQGSPQHLALLKKYVYDSSVLSQILSQDCFVNIEGASNFSLFNFLSFSCKADTIKITYEVSYFDSDHSSKEKHKDIAVIKDNRIFFISQKRIN